MKVKNQVSIQRLIAKIDNDFNISESDWIPRVAAWTIDALSQMKVLPMEKKKRKLEVSERLANFPCLINSKEIRVYDSNGCEIEEADSANSCSCSEHTSNNNSSSSEIAVIDTTNKNGIDFMKVGTIVSSNSSNRNFTIQDNCIEINFDTDCIIVESYEVATYYDEYYDCEVPYIYDDGLLLEALAWYVLFKYLSRGSTHQVYSLKSPNQALNPFIQWNYYRPKAAASVKAKLRRNNEGWNNFFYNSTFLPRG